MNYCCFSLFRLGVLGTAICMISCSSEPRSSTTATSMHAGSNTSIVTSSYTNTQATETNATSSITPQPGVWEAVVSNGYEGDNLIFTVSADGKQVENVTFTGHWRSRTSGTEVLKNLDPLRPFDINEGKFSAVQQEENAAMWWEFTGHFTSATTAEGTYRCSFAGGENDTYKLQWTAKPL